MFKDFLDGISSYGAASRLFSKHGLWTYAIIPGFLSILLGIGIFWTAWSWSDDIGGLIDNLWQWEWGSGVVSRVAQVFGGLLVLFLGLIIFKQLILVISAPFLSLLSEKVEAVLKGDTRGVSFSLTKAASDLVRGLRVAIRNLIREILGTLLLLLIGLIPIFTPFTTAAIFLLQSYYVGFGNIDFTLERHFRYRESVRFVQNYRGLAIGNGVVFMLLLLTFIGFLIVLPLSTAAAAIETLKRMEKE